MPEDLRPQIPMIRNLAAALNIPIVELSGYEADDVMGTLARMAAARGLPAVIVSPDKDLLQLVDDADRIQVLNNRDGEVWIDRAGVKERFGVWPEQVVDMLTLMGDASDNVKGVEGIGEKGRGTSWSSSAPWTTSWRTGRNSSARRTGRGWRRPWTACPW